MKFSIVMECFLKSNVLCHTDSDVIDDVADEDILCDAACGWASSLRKNMLILENVEVLSDEVIAEVYEIFSNYKSKNSSDLIDKILEKYPGNIDWGFDSITVNSFNILLKHFLKWWIEVNSNILL